MPKAEQQTELETVRKKNGGILRPAEVVSFARDPETALHKRFEWDDTEAAIEYRLEQARHIIRVTVCLVGDNPDPIHAYVSLISDRKGSDSYRSIEEVMRSPKLREELVAQALREANSWRSRYERFSELAPIVKEIKRAQGRVKPSLRNNVRAATVRAGRPSRIRRGAKVPSLV